MFSYRAAPLGNTLFFVLALVFLSFLVVSCLLLLVALMFLSYFPCNNYISKLSAFECGFSTLGYPLVGYSIHFSNLILVFVAFDLELVFFLGFLFSSSYSVFLFFGFWVLVAFTYYLEFWLKSFKWSN